MTWLVLLAYVLGVAVFIVGWSRLKRDKTAEEQAREDEEQMEYLRRWRERRR